MNIKFVRLAFATALLTFVVFGSQITIADNYEGSTYSEVWKAASDPKAYGNAYDRNNLPVFEPPLSGGNNPSIYARAKQTIDDRRDIVPYFQKRVHANGMCFAGTWKITEDNPYTGYFKKGSSALIIARISEAAGNPIAGKGKRRAFGFVGKLFPTTDPTDPKKYKTANFQAIDDLGGTWAKHFTDQTLMNHPNLTPNLQLAETFLTAGEVAIAFEKADPNHHIKERQLYEVSELGLDDPTKAITPDWFGIVASPGTPVVDMPDFRNELELNRRNGKLSLDIVTAADEFDDWHKTGVIELTQDALAPGCDHIVTWHHPAWRDDLRYE